MYPRDQNRDEHFQGRCKVRLFDENGAPVKEEIKSSEHNEMKGKNRALCIGHALLVHVAHMIPKLKTRQQRGGATAPNEAPGTSGGRKKKK